MILSMLVAVMAAATRTAHDALQELKIAVGKAEAAQGTPAR